MSLKIARIYADAGNLDAALRLEMATTTGLSAGDHCPAGHRLEVCLVGGRGVGELRRVGQAAAGTVAASGTLLGDDARSGVGRHASPSSPAPT